MSFSVDFYEGDSAVKGIRLKEVEDGGKLMVVEFQYARNFWKDLTWALTYQEITFIFNHLELAERFNFKDYESAGSLEEPIKPEEETWFLTKLYKIQWTERIQRIGELSSIPKNFYSWAKKHIRKLKEESKIHLEKMRGI